MGYYNTPADLAALREHEAFAWALEALEHGREQALTPDAQAVYDAILAILRGA